MTSLRPKLWTSASIAILLGGLAACGEAGEKGPMADQATSGNAPAAGEGGEGGAEGGGAGGEAGAQAAYLGVPAESRAALRLAHLKGFFLIAQKQTEGPDAAAALAGQGMLEVYDAAPGAFQATGVNEAALRKAAQTGAAADLAAAVAAIEAAQAKAAGDAIAITRGLVDISQGLYKNVVTEGGVDPIEYQHSLGAALSAQTVLARSSDPRAAKAKGEVDRLVALWPATEAPATPTPVGQLSAQASRVILALN